MGTNVTKDINVGQINIEKSRKSYSSIKSYIPYVAAKENYKDMLKNFFLWLF